MDGRSALYFEANAAQALATGLYLVQSAQECILRTGRERSHVRVVLAQIRASQLRLDECRELEAHLAERRRLLRRGTE